MSARPPGMGPNFPQDKTFTDPSGQEWTYDLSKSKWVQVTDSSDNTDNRGEGNSPPLAPVKVTGPTRFNPPLISLASGSWIPDGPVPEDRNRIVGPASESLRVRQRGVLLPDFTFAADWRTSEPIPQPDANTDAADDRIIYNAAPGSSLTGGDATIDAGTEYNVTSLAGVSTSATGNTGSNGKNVDPKVVSALSQDGKNYGFRFHYNPSQIGMASAMVSGINPALIMTGRDTTVPIGGLDSGTGSISITMYLNRIEDMSFIKRRGGSYVLNAPEGIRRRLYEGRNLNQEEMEGIVNRGTEYDLEFLFRTIMGKPFPTNLRGMTADLGIIWGTPTQLWLSKRMRYRGRVTGIQWSHRSFTRFMVPMWTEVSLTFTRYPDVAAWNSATEVDDGYQYSKALGYNIPAVSPRSEGNKK